LRTEEAVRMRQRANRREWSRRVARWRRSGKTSKEFAAETGVNPGTLLWWSTKLRAVRGVAEAAGATRRQDRGSAERREPWPIVELSGGVVDDRFELEVGGGRRLRIPPGFDADALGRLLAVLK
jgi:transposase